MAFPIVSFVSAVEPYPAANKRTGFFDVNAGELMIWLAGDAGGTNANRTFTPTSPGLTWVIRANQGGGTSAANAEIYTAYSASAVTDQHVAASSSVPADRWSGCLLRVNNHNESTFGGATSIEATSSDLQGTITTTGADSITISVFADRGLATPAGRTLLSNSTEPMHFSDGTIYNFYVTTRQIAVAAASGTGYSAPISGAVCAIGNIEVRAGSTGPPPTPPSPPTQEEGTFNTLAVDVMTNYQGV